MSGVELSGAAALAEAVIEASAEINPASSLLP
jgi:hypothetical protein